MHSTLKRLSEIVAKANDVFDACHKSVGTVLGIMDQALRKQGINADAVTIDCIQLNKKIVLLIHDEKPDSVDIALGNKEGDIHSSSTYDLNQLTQSTVVSIMEDNFLP
tara:strand:+ start:2447 stop:2770 length:324 start_codon:yes stop_codon:yes gene_type:complete